MTEIELSAGQARELTDRIKLAVEATWELIKEAYQSRAWKSLGYSSWDDYCTREFGTSRIKLPREERQEVVSSMREIGMSTRAIASATGSDRKTIMKDVRDVQVVHFGPPEPAPVVGTDGKTYVPKPRPEPETPEWEEVGTIPQSRLKGITRPTATAIPQSELDELNEVEEVRPVFQAPGEPSPRPPLPATPRKPPTIDRELEAQARAKSSAPDSGHEINAENAADRNVKRFDAIAIARNASRLLNELAGILTDVGGIKGMDTHLEDIQAALDVATEANKTGGIDAEINNLLEGN